MALSSAEHTTVAQQTKHARAARAREHRADGGGVYRTVAVVVRIVDVPDETDPTTDKYLRLAIADVPSEAGRYFRVWRQRGRWRCRCAAFQALGGCHHAGHLQAQEAAGC